MEGKKRIDSSRILVKRRENKKKKQIKTKSS